MAKIFLTRSIPTSALEALTQAGHELQVSEFDRSLSPEDLIQKASGCDCLISLLTDNVSGQIMDAIGPQLKIIANYAVGFDNIDVAAATKRGIVVANTPSDEVNESVAEFTWSLLLSLARRVVEADEYARKGVFSGWQPDLFVGTDVYGKTLGIIGLGRIGSMVARRAKGFNMQLLYYNRHPDPQAETSLGVKHMNLEELLRSSDFISLHVPLSKETFHLINTNELSLMKPTALLINTSRGPVVNEHALLKALKTGTIAGAALDVHENEMEMNPELLLMENVIMTPHVASSTQKSRDKMGQQVVTAILNTLTDQKPENIVNKEVWENRRK